MNEHKNVFLCGIFAQKLIKNRKMGACEPEEANHYVN